MNGINIYSNGWHKSKRQLAEDVVKFCLKELMPKVRKINIAIFLKTKLLDDYEHFGECEYVQHGFYDLYIHVPCEKEDFIETICHECVHIKQYHRKELVDSTPTHVKFKNQFFENDEENYDNFPWEIEANELGLALKEKYEKEVL